jgi:hypothetical protein
VTRCGEVSKPGELDYVAACGPSSERFGDGADAILRAYYWSQELRLSASVSFDGKEIARINVWGLS